MMIDRRSVIGLAAAVGVDLAFRTRRPGRRPSSDESIVSELSGVEVTNGSSELVLKGVIISEDRTAEHVQFEGGNFVFTVSFLAGSDAVATELNRITSQMAEHWEVYDVLQGSGEGKTQYGAILGSPDGEYWMYVEAQPGTYGEFSAFNSLIATPDNFETLMNIISEHVRVDDALVFDPMLVAAAKMAFEEYTGVFDGSPEAGNAVDASGIVDRDRYEGPLTGHTFAFDPNLWAFEPGGMEGERVRLPQADVVVLFTMSGAIFGLIIDTATTYDALANDFDADPMSLFGSSNDTIDVVDSHADEHAFGIVGVLTGSTGTRYVAWRETILIDDGLGLQLFLGTSVEAVQQEYDSMVNEMTLDETSLPLHYSVEQLMNLLEGFE